MSLCFLQNWENGDDGLRVKLNKIMASDDFTPTPEMKYKPTIRMGNISRRSCL
ncbi:hypothetical protein CsSME_00041612 [Camellia sinensis var. sinensis]